MRMKCGLSGSEQPFQGLKLGESVLSIAELAPHSMGRDQLHGHVMVVRQRRRPEQIREERQGEVLPPGPHHVDLPHIPGMALMAQLEPPDPIREEHLGVGGHADGPAIEQNGGPGGAAVDMQGARHAAGPGQSSADQQSGQLCSRPRRQPRTRPPRRPGGRRADRERRDHQERQRQWSSQRSKWRTGRDSNPRTGKKPVNRLAICRNRPLCHLSAQAGGILCGQGGVCQRSNRGALPGEVPLAAGGQSAACRAHLDGTLPTGCQGEEVGGGSGIRTHEPRRANGFQDRRNRPLCHPSGRSSSLAVGLPVALVAVFACVAGRLRSLGSFLLGGRGLDRADIVENLLCGEDRAAHAGGDGHCV